jgi:integrase
VVGNQNNNGMEQGVWSLYLYAMKSPVTREKYQKRLEKFFDFINIKGKTIEEKSKAFVNKAKNEGNDWTFNSIYNFMKFQLDRANKKEITGSTIRNYLKSIKLFCEMADFPIAWKKISRGLRRAKSYSDDRIPTIEEIKKLLEYPDRRIKAIIYTTASSGIRLGAWDYLKWKHVGPIQRGNADNEVVAAKLVAYGGEKEEYYGFIINEAYNAIKEWIDFRSSLEKKLPEIVVF